MSPVLLNKIDKFVIDFPFKRYKSGEIFLQPNDDQKLVFYLSSGIVRVYSLTPTGVELTINHFKNPSFFPVEGALLKKKNRYFYEALKDIKLYRIPCVNFVDFLKEEPEVMVDLLNRIYRGLEGYQLRMESLLYGDPEIRVLTDLFIKSQRFGEDDEDGWIKISTTHQQIASECGLSRETVSRIIERLAGKGILKINRGNLHVLRKGLWDKLNLSEQSH